MKPPTTLRSALPRILALDYLRGFFIVIIIVDHLWRWPNLFQFVSGRGELWSSAAEGFVIISGLLVGYVRGYKNRQQPLKQVSGKLIRRGLTLYLWMIITTLTLVGASWLFSFHGSMAYVPIPAFAWQQLIADTLSLTYVHTLTHFLYLYAIFLILSPLAIWLMRQGRAWLIVIASALGWWLGVSMNIEWLQWQALFFLPSIAGYYLDSLFTYYYRLQLPIRRVVRYGVMGLTLITVVIAMTIAFGYPPGEYDSILFSREPITIATILTSFVWFAGLFSLFQLLLPWLKKWFGWLLGTFGRRSLTAYILHTIPLIVCQLLFADSTNIWLNSFLAMGCIIATWGLLKIPHINRLIPQ